MSKKIDTKIKQNFDIVYKQDKGSGWWTASYEGKTPIVVQERTIEKAHQKMREGLSSVHSLDVSQFTMTEKELLIS